MASITMTVNPIFKCTYKNRENGSGESKKDVKNFSYTKNFF